MRLANDRPLLVDTVTDVLRLACALAGGDVSLAEPTAFRSLPRPLRKGLMTALESVVATPAKLGDVARHRERWKRLGERLHPHEYPELPHAQDVFAVARGDRRVRSLAGRVEMALAEGDLPAAVRGLSVSPGLLFRSVDRLLRAAGDEPRSCSRRWSDADAVSGRVLLGLREHLHNRCSPTRPGSSSTGQPGPGSPRTCGPRSTPSWFSASPRCWTTPSPDGCPATRGSSSIQRC